MNPSPTRIEGDDPPSILRDDPLPPAPPAEASKAKKRGRARREGPDFTWSESVLAGSLSCLAGLVIAGVVAFAAFRWYPFTGLEGAGGYFVGLNALAGGLFGFVIGLLGGRGWNAWGSPRLRAMTTVTHVGSAAAAVVLVIGIVTCVTLWLLADIPPEIDGQRLNVEVEFRLAASDSTPPAELADPSFTLASVVDGVKRKEMPGVLRIAQARKDDSDRWIIPASAPLFTTRGQRLVEAHLGGDLVGLYTIPLPGRPGPENQQWSDWWPKPPPPPKSGAASAPAKTGSDKGGKTAPPPPPSPAANGTASSGKPIATMPDGPGYRFRVVLVGGAPIAGAASKKRAAVAKPVDAAKAEPSLADLLGHTRLSATDAERDAAIRSIVGRPNYVTELSAAMVSPDNRLAADAMYVIAKLPDPPASLAQGVLAAGQDIAARLDRLNAGPGDAAGQFAASSDLTIRFAAWMDAVRVLRRSGGVDFMPQLIAILERSRANTGNAMVQHDIRRVASRFAKEWGAIAPQAGDPPW